MKKSDVKEVLERILKDARYVQDRYREEPKGTWKHNYLRGALVAYHYMFDEFETLGFFSKRIEDNDRNIKV